MCSIKVWSESEKWVPEDIDGVPQDVPQTAFSPGLSLCDPNCSYSSFRHAQLPLSSHTLPLRVSSISRKAHNWPLGLPVIAFAPVGRKGFCLFFTREKVALCFMLSHTTPPRSHGIPDAFCNRVFLPMQTNLYRKTESRNQQLNFSRIFFFSVVSPTTASVWEKRETSDIWYAEPSRGPRIQQAATDCSHSSTNSQIQGSK